jgi:hypothetical protein
MRPQHVSRWSVNTSERDTQRGGRKLRLTACNDLLEGMLLRSAPQMQMQMQMSVQARGSRS